MGAMNGLRKHFTMGLVLLMCTLTGHCSESAPSASPATAAIARRDAQHDLRRMIEMVKHVEEGRGRHSAETEAPSTSRVKTSPAVPKDLRNLKTDRGDQAVGEWTGRDPYVGSPRGCCIMKDVVYWNMLCRLFTL